MRPGNSNCFSGRWCFSGPYITVLPYLKFVKGFVPILNLFNYFKYGNELLIHMPSGYIGLRLLW